MKFESELSFRLFRGRGILSLGLTGWISLVGLILGVACLVVSMAVVSGFEQTLQRSVSDSSGHVQVLKISGARSEGLELRDQVKAAEPNFVASTRVLWVEAVAAHQGQITGVLLQGMDLQDVPKVLALQNRLVEGDFQVAAPANDEITPALIGKGLAARFGLHKGDQFRVVIPLMTDLDPSSFRRKVGVFRVQGILDLGKYEFDQRVIVTDLKRVQSLADVGDRFSGLLIRLTDPSLARESSERLSKVLGTAYRVRDWRSLNENIFDAVKYERPILFFVILIIVLAAAFNVSSSLWISVVQRYPEIGILKAMGLPRRKLIMLFAGQGLLLGVLGCLGGSLLGGALCLAFHFGQKVFGLLPGSVYKLDRVDLVIRPTDLLAIFCVTLLICVIATLSPARKGAGLSAVEGLRYE